MFIIIADNFVSYFYLIDIPPCSLLHGILKLLLGRIEYHLKEEVKMVVIAKYL